MPFLLEGHFVLLNLDHHLRKENFSFQIVEEKITPEMEVEKFGQRMAGSGVGLLGLS